MRCCLLTLLLTCSLAAADGPRTTIPVPPGSSLHGEFLKIAKAGGVDLLFLGDSITDFWRDRGREVWDRTFAPLKAANFGISGDRTENVIWRLRHGELDGIHPKLVVLMIGTNNGDPAEDVALGIKTIIADIQERSPGTRILLLGIFPRGDAQDGMRTKNAQVNQLIATYANPSDPRRVVYLDIGARFLGPNREIPREVMPDALHPGPKGYQIWADAIIDPVRALLHDDPGHLAPTFAKPSAAATVAKAEEAIAAGNVVSGCTTLEKLAADPDAATAAAAKASLAVVGTWKEGVEAEIARLRGLGDVVAAAEMATTMGRIYSGDAGRTYRDQAAELRKDPAHAAGKEYRKLAAYPAEARRDARFAKLVEAFVKRNPSGFYAQQTQALVLK